MIRISVLVLTLLGTIAPAMAGGEQPDPFTPRDATHSASDCPDERPRIEDLEISGVFILDGSGVAQARAGARNYLLREGDRLCDGELTEIESDRVVLKTLLLRDVEHRLAGAGGGGDCAWTPSVDSWRLSCSSELLVLPAAANDEPDAAADAG